MSGRRSSASWRRNHLRRPSRLSSRPRRDPWREIHDLVDSLSEPEQEVPGYFHEGWSVKDLLGHLGSWLAEAGVAMERVHGGTYRPGELDIDAKNEEFLQALRPLSLDETRAHAEAARARMRSLKTLPTITPARVDGKGRRRSLRGAPAAASGVGVRASPGSWDLAGLNERSCRTR